MFALLGFALAASAAALAAESPAFQVKVSGHGKPMLLVPGLSCPGDVWDTTVARFGDRYECHVFTLAGFAGAPPRAGSGPFLETVREDLATYIREHGLHHPAIVGHSLGGFLALDLAARHPELAGKLIVVDAVPFLPGLMRPGTTVEEARGSAAGMRQFFESLDVPAYEQQIRSGAGTRAMVTSEADHERIVAWSLASDRATVTDAMTEMFSADLREGVAAIASPTLVFATWIGYRPFANHERTEQLVQQQFAKLKGAKLIVSDTARHFIMFDDPEWLFAQMDAFLASSDAR